jgi:hypothetical protein
MRNMWEIFKIFLEETKPYQEKFRIWFNQQEGVVKAAVFALVGTFITGCFLIFAAIVSRPAPAPILIITATAAPTLTPTSTPILATLATPSTASKIPASTPPTPILEWLSNISQNQTIEMTTVIFGIFGLIFIILGLWQAWLVVFDRIEKYKNVIFSVILVCIILFALWQQWGWIVLIVAIGSVGLAPLFVGLIIGALLQVPYLGASIIGATVAGFLGIGCSLIYLAIPGPFISDYIKMGFLIGISTGAILGLLLSTRYSGNWQ